MTIDTKHCYHKRNEDGTTGHQVPRDKMSYIYDSRGHKRHICVDCKDKVIEGRLKIKGEVK